MKLLASIVFLIILNPVYGAFDKYFTSNTMRLDYFRTGNYNTEILSFDELISEGHWAGSIVNLIDTFDYGVHKFEVFDLASGVLIFSRNYASLFGEWQTTEEAKHTWRTFGETIIFPFPKEKVVVAFFSRARKGNWEKRFDYTIDPTSIFVSKEAKTVFPVLDIHVKGGTNSCLDVVFLPEGYTDTEMEKFKNDSRRFADFLLKSKPFSGSPDKINIRAVLASSLESGTDIPGNNTWKQTAMNSSFYTFGSERYLMTMDVKSVRNLAANAPYEQIVIIVNSPKYGGGGIYNYYSVATSDNPVADYVFIHEFGHAFGALGDEYYSSEVAYLDYYDLAVEPWEPNLTTLVDFNRKWKDMVNSKTPIPTPADNKFECSVGAFEGGGYTAQGVFRPSLDCTMKSLKYNAFCPVCQRALTRMLEFCTQ